MKRVFAIGAVITSLVAFGYGAYHLGTQRGMAKAPVDAAASAATPSTERKVLYWHDPMVPGHRFDKPGKSPFMDMDLEPVYAEEASAAGVAVNPGMTQSLGIRTATVRRASLNSTLDVPGVVGLNERSTVVVQARTPGFVEQLFVRATLDPVSKGEALVAIYAPEWAGALSEYLALRRASIDSAIVAAARERLRLLSIPDAMVATAERDGVAQSRFTISSPASGVVTELAAREGMAVQTGMTLFRIVDLTTVWVEASVPAQQVADVRVGAPARASTEAFPGRSFNGKISAILPQVDATTRTLRVRVELANPGLVLKPGMFVAVALGSAPTQGLVVPQEAVIATGRRAVVIVVGDDGRFAPTDVTLGRSVGEDVEVRSGVSAGQRVVTSGQFLLDSEASLKSALPRMGAAPSTEPATSSAATYRSEGRVEKVAADEMTLSHEPVPELKWPAMTMGFRSSPLVVSKDIKVGDRVRFQFMEKDGAYELTQVERAGRTP